MASRAAAAKISLVGMEHSRLIDSVGPVPPPPPTGKLLLSPPQAVRSKELTAVSTTPDAFILFPPRCWAGHIRCGGIGHCPIFLSSSHHHKGSVRRQRCSSGATMCQVIFPKQRGSRKGSMTPGALFQAPGPENPFSAGRDDEAGRSPARGGVLTARERSASHASALDSLHFYRIEYVSTGRYDPPASSYWARHLCSLDSASTVF